jgi:hypothetical protein
MAIALIGAMMMPSIAITTEKDEASISITSGENYWNPTLTFFICKVITG